VNDREFAVFQALVYGRTGIVLGPHRRPLLQARLGKRLRALGLASFTEYHRLLMERDAGGEEMNRLVNAITTNKTEFLREPHHFDYLAGVWSPAVKARLAENGNARVRAWSAACSTGEEAYTIALTLLDALGPVEFDIRILASDIDTEVLGTAASGVYAVETLAAFTSAVLMRHFLKGTGAKTGLVRVRPEVRRLVTFRHINLLDDAWPIHTRFDVIFCRNVLIYFDRPTQQRVLEHLLEYLQDDGLLVLGHSESVHGLVAGLRHVETTIYQREKESEACRPRS
jgi:chemotaxis protein methyltransferase CheR